MESLHYSFQTTLQCILNGKSLLLYYFHYYRTAILTRLFNRAIHHFINQQQNVNVVLTKYRSGPPNRTASDLLPYFSQNKTNSLHTAVVLPGLDIRYTRFDRYTGYMRLDSFSNGNIIR